METHPGGAGGAGECAGDTTEDEVVDEGVLLDDLLDGDFYVDGDEPTTQQVLDGVSPSAPASLQPTRQPTPAESSPVSSAAKRKRKALVGAQRETARVNAGIRRRQKQERFRELVSDNARLEVRANQAEALLVQTQAQFVQLEQQLEKQKTLGRWPAKQAVLGMHETAVSARDPVFLSRHFKALSSCVNHVLCREGYQIFQRAEFEPSREGSNVRGSNRFIWGMLDYDQFHMEPTCKSFWDAVRYIQEQFVGHTLRDQRYSKSAGSGDIYIMDSGDYKTLFSKCTREGETHRDYDGGRGNSISVMIALDDDCIVLQKTVDEQYILHVKAGEMAAWNSAVYHVGAGHVDFDCSELSKMRRRVFMYFDDSRYTHPATGVVQHPKDVDGMQLHESHIPIPGDYNCHIFEGMPSFSAAYHALTSRHLEGRVIVGEITRNQVYTNAGPVRLPS